MKMYVFDGGYGDYVYCIVDKSAEDAAMSIVIQTMDDNTSPTSINELVGPDARYSLTEYEIGTVFAQAI